MGIMNELACAMAERPGRIDRVRTVDFSVIPPLQQAMHQRLENWARGQRDPLPSAVSPGFGLYRSSDARRAERVSAPVLVDQLDARRINAAIVAMGLRHRRALGWYYVQNCHHARQQAEELCLSLHGLAEHVIGARQGLMDLGV